MFDAGRLLMLGFQIVIKNIDYETLKGVMSRQLKPLNFNNYDIINVDEVVYIKKRRV